MMHMSCSPGPSLGQESLSSKQIKCKYQVGTVTGELYIRYLCANSSCHGHMVLEPCTYMSGYFWIPNFFFADSKIPQSTLYWICLDLLVATLKSGFKHIQTHRKKGKGKVAGSKMSKCMWMEPRYMWRKQGEDLINNIPLKLTNTLPSVWDVWSVFFCTYKVQVRTVVLLFIQIFLFSGMYDW